MSLRLYHIPEDRLAAFIVEQKELTFSERLHLGDCPECITKMAQAVMASIERETARATSS